VRAEGSPKSPEESPGESRPKKLVWNNQGGSDLTKTNYSNWTETTDKAWKAKIH
jgi:hypothetical protein